MSGFEVAGIVLGALPLVIDALAAYRAGVGLVASVKKFRGLLDTLIHRLRMQQTFFRVDIEKLLGKAKVPEIAELGELTDEKCVAVLKDVRTAAHVTKYLGNLYGPFLEILGYYESLLKNIVSMLRNGYLRKTTNDGDLENFLHDVTTWGMSFVKIRIRFTIDRRSLEALVDDLGTERYWLSKVIKMAESRQPREAPPASKPSIRMAKLFKQVQACASCLHKAVCHHWGCDRHDSHKMMMRLENRINVLPWKEQKAHLVFHLCLSLEDSLLQEVEVEARMHESADDGIETSQMFSAAQSERVSTITITTVDYDEPRPASVPAANICDHAEEAFGRGRILGLELKSGALGLRKEISHCRQSFSSMMTLTDLLAAASQNEPNRMALKQQTMLALNVATAVLQLCRTSWYCAPWGSQAIKFLVEGNGNVVVHSPYVEKMVNAAQPPVGTLATGTTTQTTKSTVLELAVLILEILHHKLIETWSAENQQGSTSTFSERFQAATNWVENSCDKLLPNHLQAVETCLAQCVRGKLEWDDEFQLLYCENVIQPLQQLVLPGH